MSASVSVSVTMRGRRGSRIGHCLLLTTAPVGCHYSASSGCGRDTLYLSLSRDDKLHIGHDSQLDRTFVSSPFIECLSLVPNVICSSATTLTAPSRDAAPDRPPKKGTHISGSVRVLARSSHPDQSPVPGPPAVSYSGVLTAELLRHPRALQAQQ